MSGEHQWHRCANWLPRLANEDRMHSYVAPRWLTAEHGFMHQTRPDEALMLKERPQRRPAKVVTPVRSNGYCLPGSTEFELRLAEIEAAKPVPPPKPRTIKVVRPDEVQKAPVRRRKTKGTQSKTRERMASIKAAKDRDDWLVFLVKHRAKVIAIARQYHQFAACQTFFEANSRFRSLVPCSDLSGQWVEELAMARDLRIAEIQKTQTPPYE
jgi:hypothetical protein